MDSIFIVYFFDRIYQSSLKLRPDKQDLKDSFIFSFPACPPSRAAQARRAGKEMRKPNPPDGGGLLRYSINNLI